MFQSECQARYITGCMVDMIQSEISSIDVRQEVHDDYVRRVDAEHDRMIWSHPGMTTYYRNAQGRVVTVMPWRLVDYWAMTRSPDLSDFRLGPVDQPY
jgi:4-hydroxyacetophenone monooxygenase